MRRKTLEKTKADAKIEQKEQDKKELALSLVLAADVANYLKQFYSERPDRKHTLMKHVDGYLAKRVAAGKPKTHLSPHVAPIFFTTPISKFTDAAVKKGKKRPDSLY